MNNGYGIPDHLFNAHSGEAGNTWTLATRFGQLLHKIERKYGFREPGWTLLGVEFHDDVPQVWFPGSGDYPPRRHIVIMLSAAAFSNEKQAIYQLAHECVHLLSPGKLGSATVMEEGLATAFSEDIIEEWFGEKNKAGYTNDQRYRDAAAHVRQLLQQEPDAILHLRGVEPAFSRMTAATFVDAGLNVPTALVDELLSKFSYSE
jgi:hypothetical protein